jgi:tetratricopeptide (TPR) repeat protein
MRRLTVFAAMMAATVQAFALTPYEAAQKLLQAQNDAAAAFESALAAAPKDIHAQLSAAQFYYQIGEYAKVTIILDGATNDMLRRVRAKAFARLGKDTEALADFERVIEFDDEAQWLYAGCLERKNLFPKAKEIYTKLSDSADFGARAKERMDALAAKKTDLTPELVEALKNDIKQTEYPDADSVVVFEDEQVTLNKDNTSVIELHALVKVMNEKGRDKWAELDFGYDSTYERIELDFARTVTTDGQVIVAGAEHIRDVSRYMNFPMYSNARAFIVSMPQVTDGAYIEYKLRIVKNKLINEKDISVIYSLLGRSPVKRSTIAVRAPKESGLTASVINGERWPLGLAKDAAVSEKAGVTELRYEFRDVPMIIPESQMPELPVVNPAIVFSTFDSWDAFAAWWRNLYQDKMVLSDETKAFVKKLVANAPDVREKARRVYEFCSRKVRYVGIEYGDAGYEPHKAEEVFFNRYGDCKDQAILLVSMLREIGIAAYPVLIPTDDAYDLQEKTVASYFDHAIACAQINGERVYMDPTASTAQFGVLPTADQDRGVLVFTDKGYEIARTPQQPANGVLLAMVMDVKDDETAKVTRRLEYSGFYAAAYRQYYIDTPPSVIKDTLLRKARSIASLAELTDMRIDKVDDYAENPVLSYGFTAPNLLGKAGVLRVMPTLIEEHLGAENIDKNAREFPIDLGGLYTLTTDIEIKLPATLSIEHLPEKVVIDNAWYAYESSYTVMEASVAVHEVFTVKKRFVAPAEYKDFKKSVEVLLNESKNQIILRRQAQAA